MFWHFKKIIIFNLLILNGVSIAYAQDVKANCSKEVPLECAKLGFKLKKENKIEEAYEAYSKGCEFGDSTSCFNRDNLNTQESEEEKSHRKLRVIWQNQICNCSQIDVKKYNRTGHVNVEHRSSIVERNYDHTTTKLVKISIEVNHKTGTIEKIEVIDPSISDKAVECIKNIKNILFYSPIANSDKRKYTINYMLDYEH